MLRCELHKNVIIFIHLLSLSYMFWSCRISFIHNKYLVTLSDFKKVTNQCIDDKWIRDTFEEYFLQMLSPVFSTKYELLGNKAFWDGFYFTGWHSVMYGKAFGSLAIQKYKPFFERDPYKMSFFFFISDFRLGLTWEHDVLGCSQGVFKDEVWWEKYAAPGLPAPL